MPPGQSVEVSSHRIFVDLHLNFDIQPLKAGQLSRSLELMAGVASLSVSLSVLNWQTYCVDTIYGIMGHNLSNAFVQERILKMVAAGVFAFIHLGLICTSWTRLANPPYRSTKELDGLKSLSPEKAKWVKEQNILHDFSLRVCEVSKKSKVTVANKRHKVLCSLENGDTTMVWDHPRTKKTCTEGEGNDNGCFHRTAMCQWGLPWRKTTKIWATRRIEGIERLCTCGTSHDEAIKGSVKIRLAASEKKKSKWVSRSSVASAYAPSLCDAWAAKVDAMFRP